MGTWIELPVGPELLDSLRELVPRPLGLSSPVGGPYHEPFTPQQRAAIEASLQPHLVQVMASFEACGWATAGERTVRRMGRSITFVWPWEWTDGRADGRTEGNRVHRMGGETFDADKVAVVWQDVTLSALVHTCRALVVGSNVLRVPFRYTSTQIDDAVSRMTDLQRHTTFAAVAHDRGVTIHDGLDSEAPPPRFLCRAAMASSRIGGLRRFFVPFDTDDATHLRGFVSSDSDILDGKPTRADADRGGVIFCEVPDGPAVRLAEAGGRFCCGMDNANVLEELYISLDGGLPRRLRCYGVDEANQHTWAYRAAFVQWVSDVLGSEVHYLECGMDMASRSGTALVFSPHAQAAPSRTELPHLPATDTTLLWNGIRWALLRR